MTLAVLTAAAITLLLPTPAPEGGALSRRALLSTGGSAAAAVALAPLAAVADVRGANQEVPTNERDVNKLLSGYGFAPLKVPGGYRPLVQYIGTAPPANIDGTKQRERAFASTLLVRFVYPNGWLVETPTITENGEAGNIGANNYVKGDGCNFAAAPLPRGDNIESLAKNKEFFKGWLSSQMSNDVYEDVKIKKITVETKPDGVEMLRINFGYTLLTRAGFTVLRKGMASAMIADNAVVGIVTATTELRYKELTENLETMTDSFRAYSVKAPVFDSGFAPL